MRVTMSDDEADRILRMAALEPVSDGAVARVCEGVRRRLDAKLRAGMRVRITKGHGDCDGATGTLVRTGPRAQWLIRLDVEHSAKRPDGLCWSWDSEMEPIGA